MYFITTKRMLEVCFSAHPNIQYRTVFLFNRRNFLLNKNCSEGNPARFFLIYPHVMLQFSLRPNCNK